MKLHYLIPLALLAAIPVHGQDDPYKKPEPTEKKKDHFVKVEQPVEEEGEVAVGILVEYIQVDHRIANKMIRQYASQAANLQPMRDELETMLDEGTAELIETDWVQARSGQRAKTESITERIYPTEYDPPEIPNQAGGVLNPSEGTDETDAPEIPTTVSDRSPFPMTAATPTAFEHRNVGSTLEVDPVIGADRRVIDLNLAPELVQEIGMTYFSREEIIESNYGVDHMGMPLFYTMKATTQISIVPGNYALLSIEKPHDQPDKRIFMLVRADLIPVR